MTIDPKAAARQVATSTAPASIPVPAKICGFTKMMYAMVRKVVKPATTSRRTVELRCSSSKYLNTGSYSFVGGGLGPQGADGDGKRIAVPH